MSIDPLSHFRVDDCMSRVVRFVGLGQSVEVAAKQMRLLDMGLMLVCEGGRVVGVLTDRDLVLRSTAEGSRPGAVAVRSVMSDAVRTCRADDTLARAAERMRQEKVRRLVVTGAAGRPMGVLSLGDLARAPAGGRLAAAVLGALTEGP